MIEERNSGASSCFFTDNNKQRSLSKRGYLVFSFFDFRGNKLCVELGGCVVSGVAGT